MNMKTLHYKRNCVLRYMNDVCHVMDICNIINAGEKRSLAPFADL